jgi:antitoxin (DNA-binding transcriptional repressor) of toxin-antitoxin stability system
MPMKAITVGDLHERTEQLIHEVSRQEGFVITEKGETVAMLTAARAPRALGKPLPRRDPVTLPKTGADSTVFISDDRGVR